MSYYLTISHHKSLSSTLVSRSWNILKLHASNDFYTYQLAGYTKHPYPIKKNSRKNNRLRKPNQPEDIPLHIMCIGLKVRCNDCQKLTVQIITIPCKAGSRHRPGRDLRATYSPQCNGSGCVDYTERTTQNCVDCYNYWRICKLLQLRVTQDVLEQCQHELERPYQLTEEDEIGPDREKACLSRNYRLLKADTAIALQIVRRQVKGLENQIYDEAQAVMGSIEQMNNMILSDDTHNGMETGVVQGFPTLDSA